MANSLRPTWVYIAKCCDGSYYTGVSADVMKRIEQHNLGRGAKYTLQRRPVTLIYSEVCESLSAALKREHQIKQWSRVQKEALVQEGKKRRRKRVRLSKSSRSRSPAK